MANDKEKPEPPRKPDDVPKGPPVETEGGGSGDPPPPPPPPPSPPGVGDG